MPQNDTLRVTQAGLDINEEFEGNELVGYICPAGKATIGRGHTEAAGGKIHYEDGVVTSKVRVGKAISPAESDRLYRFDTDNAENALERLLKRPATPHQFDAMYLLFHNLGEPQFKSSTLLRKFNAGDIAGASRAFEPWNKITDPRTGKKVVSRGLVRRRSAEQALFDGDIERAYAIAGTTRHLPMPQAVATPEKATKLLDNPKAVTAAAGGALTVANAADQADGKFDMLSTASDALYSVTSVTDAASGLLGGLSGSFLIYAAIFGVIGWLAWRGYQEWRDREEDGDEEFAQDVEDIA